MSNGRCNTGAQRRWKGKRHHASDIDNAFHPVALVKKRGRGGLQLGAKLTSSPTKTFCECDDHRRDVMALPLCTPLTSRNFCSRKTTSANNSSVKGGHATKDVVYLQRFSFCSRQGLTQYVAPLASQTLLPNQSSTQQRAQTYTETVWHRHARAHTR